MDSAETLRDQAAWFRELAEHAADHAQATHLHRLADEYEAQARRAAFRPPPPLTAS